MDTLTQGLLGGVAAQCLSRRPLGRRTPVVGALGGMAPDLDVVIRSSTDPLLGLEFHRHFTHAFAFIPLGGAIVAVVLWLLARRKWAFRDLWMAATVGYATHGLLDACTSYGTQLWWPFSSVRVAWDWVAIIDPVYSGILIAGLVLAWWYRSAVAARWALGLSLAYLGLGAWQHHRAFQVQAQVIAARGQVSEQRRVFPTLLNLVAWRSVYRSGDRFHVDAIRVPLLWGTPQLVVGDTAEVYRPQAPEGSVLAEDIRRFSWFADGYLGRVPGEPDAVGDYRYGAFPHRPQPMWGIRLFPETPHRHVARVFWSRRTRSAFAELKELVWGTHWGLTGLAEAVSVNSK